MTYIFRLECVNIYTLPMPSIGAHPSFHVDMSICRPDDGCTAGTKSTSAPLTFQLQMQRAVTHYAGGWVRDLR